MHFATFDLSSYDPEDRNDALREYFAPTVGVEIVRDANRPVTGRLDTWQLGNILVLDGETPPVLLSRSRRQVAADDLEHWTLRVMRRGQILSRTGDTLYRQAAGDVVLDSMTDPFDDRWSASSWVAFVFPNEGFEHLGFVDRSRGTLTGASARLFGEFAVSLVGQLRCARPEDIPVLTSATVAMIRSCFQRPVAPGAVTDGDIAKVERPRVRATIRRHLASPRLTLERLSELTGLSRSALCRMFESHGGVARYIQEQRLQRVIEDLGDPAQTHKCISSIAEARGFYNAPAFSRTFRRRFGCSPSDMRKAARTGALVTSSVSGRSGIFKGLLA